MEVGNLECCVLEQCLLESCFAGGGIVLLYASKYPDVRTVVNISGRYDLKTGVAERLGEDFMERVKQDGFVDVKCKKTGGSLMTTEYCYVW